jgi:hypothetical protein
MTSEDERRTEQKILELKAFEERFEEDASIENYVALRRFAPGIDTEIYRFANVDPLQFLDDKLQNVGLNRSLIRGALGGDDRDIDELCLQLMERLIERKRLEAQGGTHLQSRGIGISDALVDHLIVAMIEALQQFSLEPKPSLVVLIRDRLGGAHSDIYKIYMKWTGRTRAIFLGMRLKRDGVPPTIREIAQEMGVQPSTVSRWFPNGDFPEQVEAFEKQFVKFGTDPSE